MNQKSHLWYFYVKKKNTDIPKFFLVIKLGFTLMTSSSIFYKLVYDVSNLILNFRYIQL